MKRVEPPPEDIWPSAMEQRPAVHTRFPHVVTLGVLYPEMDRAHRCTQAGNRGTLTVDARQRTAAPLHCRAPHADVKTLLRP